MTTRQKSALVRKAAKRIEDEVALPWDLLTGVSTDIVKIVLEVMEQGQQKVAA